MQSFARPVLLMLLLLIGAFSAYPQTQSKQELAEVAADKAIRRFFETLDFADIYREFYVSNPGIRRAEVEIVIGNMIAYGDRWATPEQLKLRNLELATEERAYIAAGNFHWTMSAASLTYQGDQKNIEKECSAIWEKYITPMNGKSSWPILTSRQLDDKLTVGFDALANCFRGYVVRANFDTREFQHRAQSVQESRPADPIDKLKELFAPAGMSSSENIYVVRRARFYLYLIEENGAFKIFSWNNRVRD